MHESTFDIYHDIFGEGKYCEEICVHMPSYLIVCSQSNLADVGAYAQQRNSIGRRYIHGFLSHWRYPKQPVQKLTTSTDA